MGVQSRSITARARALAGAEVPLTAADKPARALLFARMAEVIRPLPHFSLRTSFPADRHLNIGYEDGRYGDSVQLEFKEDGTLVFRAAWGRDDLVPITSEAHLLAIMKVVLEVSERQRGLRLRREKVNALRLRAMEAQVAEMARAAGFQYRFEAMQRKVKLGIRLTKDKEVVLDLPFASFQPVLDQLPSFLPTLRDLIANPLTFTIGSAHGWKHWRTAPVDDVNDAES